MQPFADFISYLENSSLADNIRENDLLFPLIESVHVLAICLVVGLTPGIGGRLSIALAIPFVFGMETIPGAVFLLTMHAVNGTSGQISSIMFGVPGDGDDAATTIDGYPMAKKGEAGRALGASVTASGVGGMAGHRVRQAKMPPRQVERHRIDIHQHRIAARTECPDLAAELAHARGDRLA